MVELIDAYVNFGHPTWSIFIVWLWTMSMNNLAYSLTNLIKMLLKVVHRICMSPLTTESHMRLSDISSAFTLAFIRSMYRHRVYRIHNIPAVATVLIIIIISLWYSSSRTASPFYLWHWAILVAIPGSVALSINAGTSTVPVHMVAVECISSSISNSVSGALPINFVTVDVVLEVVFEIVCIFVCYISTLAFDSQIRIVNVYLLIGHLQMRVLVDDLRVLGR